MIKNKSKMIYPLIGVIILLFVGYRYRPFENLLPLQGEVEEETFVKQQPPSWPQTVTLGFPEDCQFPITYSDEYELLDTSLEIPLETIDNLDMRIREFVDVLPDGSLLVFGDVSKEDTIAQIDLKSKSMTSLYGQQGIYLPVLLSESTQDILFVVSDGHDDTGMVQSKSLLRLPLDVANGQTVREVVRLATIPVLSFDFELNPNNQQFSFVDGLYPYQVKSIDIADQIETDIVSRELYGDTPHALQKPANTKIRWSMRGDKLAIAERYIGIELIDFMKETSCLIDMNVDPNIKSERDSYRFIADVIWHEDGTKAVIHTKRGMNHHHIHKTELFLLDLEREEIRLIIGFEQDFYFISSVSWIPQTNSVVWGGMVYGSENAIMNTTTSDRVFKEYKSESGIFKADLDQLSVQRVNHKSIFTQLSNNSIWVPNEDKSLLTFLCSTICQLDFSN